MHLIPRALGPPPLKRKIPSERTSSGFTRRPLSSAREHAGDAYPPFLGTLFCLMSQLEVYRIKQGQTRFWAGSALARSEDVSRCA